MIGWLVLAIVVGNVFGSPALMWAKPSELRHASLSQPGRQSVTPERLRQALVRQLERQFPMDRIELSVRILFPKQGVSVPKGPLVIQVPLDTLDGRTGRRVFRVGLSVNSRFVRMINVVVEVTAQAKVLSPVRWIKAREILTAGDVALTWIALPSLHHDFLDRKDEAVGKKAVRLLRPHAPIRHSFLTLPPVIHKGDRVLIEARHGGLLVQTVGIAKASGQPGALIPVENQRSGREILGRVLASGVVEVQF